jgi:hypothetical protein
MCFFIIIGLILVLIGFIRLRRRPRLRAGTSIEKERQKLHFGVQARALPVEECVNGRYTISTINVSCFGGFRSQADDPPKPPPAKELVCLRVAAMAEEGPAGRLA